MYQSVLTLGVLALRFVMVLTGDVAKTTNNLYRYLTTEHEWFIADNGQFVDRSVISIADATRFWYFDGKAIVDMRHNGIEKRLPYLSGEFSLGDETISMEDFFSEMRFMGGVEPPFAVLMAAFMIREKRFYDWASAKFKMFLRDGSEKEFTGVPV